MGAGIPIGVGGMPPTLTGAGLGSEVYLRPG